MILFLQIKSSAMHLQKAFAEGSAASNIIRKSTSLLVVIMLISCYSAQAGDALRKTALAEKALGRPSLIDTSSEGMKNTESVTNKSHAAEGIVSVDVAVDKDSIYLLTGKNNKGKVSLWLQISRNSGSDWSPSAEIPIPETSGATISRGADARIAKTIHGIVVLWMSHVDGARFGSGPMVSMRSIDDGKTWERVHGPADWTAGPHGFFSLAVSKGVIHSTWLDKRQPDPAIPGTQGLQYSYSKDGGKNWSPNITLDQIVCACCWTRSLADRTGNLYVLYRDKQPSDMALGIVDLKNHQWNRLSTVGVFGWDFAGCPHIGGGLAIRERGNNKEIHALVGTRKPGNTGIYHLMSSDGGKLWTKPDMLGDSSSTHGDIAIDKNGVVYAIWDMINSDINDGSTAIYLSKLDKRNHWSSPQKITNNAASASHPIIVTSGNAVISFWTEKGADGKSILGMARHGFSRH